MLGAAVWWQLEQAVVSCHSCQSRPLVVSECQESQSTQNNQDVTLTGDCQHQQHYYPDSCWSQHRDNNQSWDTLSASSPLELTRRGQWGYVKIVEWGPGSLGHTNDQYRVEHWSVSHQHEHNQWTVNRASWNALLKIVRLERRNFLVQTSNQNSGNCKLTKLWKRIQWNGICGSLASLRKSCGHRLGSHSIQSSSSTSPA